MVRSITISASMCEEIQASCGGFMSRRPSVEVIPRNAMNNPIKAEMASATHPLLD